MFFTWVVLILAIIFSSRSFADESETLAGKIWDVNSGEFVSFSAVREMIKNKTYILLGETHGRSAHQNRVAFIIGALAESGRYPTIVLEILTHEQTQIVEKYRERLCKYYLE